MNMVVLVQKEDFGQVNMAQITVHNNALISNHHLQVAHQSGAFSS